LENAIANLSNQGDQEAVKEDLIALMQRLKGRINWTETESGDD
jgi:hypothetical protein